MGVADPCQVPAQELPVARNVLTYLETVSFLAVSEAEPPKTYSSVRGLEDPSLLEEQLCVAAGPE